MKKIILITASFPYLPSEPFLETEVKYYKECENMEFTIIPLHGNKKEKREVDSQIRIDSFLIDTKSNSKLTKLCYASKILLSKPFYKELFSSNLLNRVKLWSLMGAVYSYEYYYDKFNDYFKNQKDLSNVIVYTYWNDTFTYALQSLKYKYNYKLISRVHGYDLYKERRVCSYLPLKSQFTKNIDRLYTITESANNYLEKTYGFDKDTIELARLGVDDFNFISSPNDEKTCHIVSCSHLVEVKQIHKIIESIDRISNLRKNINFIWSHIGDGPLYEELFSLAKTKLLNHDNVQFNFVGKLANNAVYSFYKNNKVDVFINTSQSEGVPVSIMEAMSCHIPIIAPNIGGISDMVEDGVNGFLLSQHCEVDEIVEVLQDINFFKNRTIRENAYTLFLEKYNARDNYIKFLNNLERLYVE